MMKHLKSVLTLFSICAIVSIALAVCFAITDPIIKEQQAAAASGALLEVMPDGGSFEKMDISTYELPATIVEVNNLLFTLVVALKRIKFDKIRIKNNTTCFIKHSPFKI